MAFFFLFLFIKRYLICLVSHCELANLLGGNKGNVDKNVAQLGHEGFFCSIISSLNVAQHGILHTVDSV